MPGVLQDKIQTSLELQKKNSLGKNEYRGKQSLNKEQAIQKRIYNQPHRVRGYKNYLTFIPSNQFIFISGAGYLEAKNLNLMSDFNKLSTLVISFL